MPFFFSWKESTDLTQLLIFAVELQKVRTKCIFLRWGWGKFQNVMYVKGGIKH